MPALKFNDIVKQIKSGAFAPVYLLWGEEDYYIDRLEAIFENEVLDDMQKEFDFSVFFGPDLKGKDKENGLQGVMANCKRFPVMAPVQLVILKEAQALDRWEALENYLQKPVASTLLVISHKHNKIDKRKSVFKLIDKIGVSFESAPLKDKDFVPWIAAHIKENGYTIQNSALAMLGESLGSSLNLIANELQKLFVNLPQGAEITEDDIERCIGINKEYNVFTLEKAVLERNLVQCRKIVNYLRSNLKNMPPQMVLVQLYRLFARILQLHALQRKGTPRSEWAQVIGIPPYFLGQYEAGARNYAYREAAHILHIIKEYDLKSKGLDSNLSPEDLSEEFIFRILHAF